ECHKGCYTSHRTFTPMLGCTEHCFKPWFACTRSIGYSAVVNPREDSVDDVTSICIQSLAARGGISASLVFFWDLRIPPFWHVQSGGSCATTLSDSLFVYRTGMDFRGRLFQTVDGCRPFLGVHRYSSCIPGVFYNVSIADGPS